MVRFLTPKMKWLSSNLYVTFMVILYKRLFFSKFYLNIVGEIKTYSGKTYENAYEKLKISCKFKILSMAYLCIYQQIFLRINLNDSRNFCWYN